MKKIRTPIATRPSSFQMHEVGEYSYNCHLGKIAPIFICLILFLTVTACGSENASSTSTCGTVVDIGLNDFVNGALESSDCRGTDIDPVTGDLSFADEYRVTLTQAGTLTLIQRSTDFDTFMFLMNTATTCANGCTISQLIISDDDSGGGTDSSISIFLNAGTYLIVANSFDPSITGNYTLQAAFTP